jgi:hypothetical protein
MKTVQIPYDLFLDLCRWHLTGLQDEDIEARIRAGLNDKLNRAVARNRYGEALAERRTDT